MAAAAAVPVAAEGKSKEKQSIEYEEGSNGIDELTKPLVSDLALLFRRIDRRVRIDRLPDEVRGRIFKYLESYGSSLMLSPEQRTRGVDVEALFYAVREGRKTRGLDGRIVEVLDALLESAVRHVARESIALVPPPEVRSTENERGA